MYKEMKIIHTFYFPFCSYWFLKRQDGVNHCACDLNLHTHQQRL